MRVASFDIVFQEIPGEVTLALNLSGCPCHCPGCHSQHLWEDVGEELNEELLDGLVARYGSMITCVCFMGGDQDPLSVQRMAEHVKELRRTNDEIRIRTAWYSGRPGNPEQSEFVDDLPKVSVAFDYMKFGPYIESLGGLKNPTTNQRLYKRTGNGWEDITSKFWNRTI